MAKTKSKESSQKTSEIINLGMDSEYLKQNLGGCLTECLIEVAEKRPFDPIEYMAHWLYKHMENKQLRQEKIDEANELAKEQAELADRTQRRIRLEAELKRLKEEEEERKRKAAEEARLEILRLEQERLDRIELEEYLLLKEEEKKQIEVWVNEGGALNINEDKSEAEQSLSSQEAVLPRLDEKEEPSIDASQGQVVEEAPPLNAGQEETFTQEQSEEKLPGEQGQVEEQAPSEEQIPAEEQAPSEEQAPAEEQAPSEEQIPAEEQAPSEEQAPAEQQALVDEQEAMDEEQAAE